MAAAAGHIDVLDVLLARNASLQARDARYGGTAADWAEEFHRDEAARHLRSVERW